MIPEYVQIGDTIKVKIDHIKDIQQYILATFNSKAVWINIHTGTSWNGMFDFDYIIENILYSPLKIETVENHFNTDHSKLVDIQYR